jgi:hypothetical protein|nr:MAG TPA: hypothetical protein [Bacteriophage sp.]
MNNKDKLVDAIDTLEYKIHVAVDILNKIDTLNDDELNDMVKLVNDSSLTIDVLNFQLTRNIIMTNNKEKLEEVFHNG